ncbi:MAG: CoA pyrophosphatase [Bdellovibrio sp.]|nr:CoA pyrophosphatase [Bdellovibrio sp.]
MTTEWHKQLKNKLGVVTRENTGEREQSAVSLILKGHAASGGPEILFIKRAERFDDPWSGHMAFPGGRRDKEDKTIAETAVRETLEEIGIQLREHEALGTLEAYSPRVSPELTVHPYVFFLHDVPHLKLDRKEVEEVHWIAVEQAFNPSFFAQSPHSFRGMTLTLPSFLLNSPDDQTTTSPKRHIWGVTYVIFLELLYVLAETTWGQQLSRERKFVPHEIWKYYPYR